MILTTDKRDIEVGGVAAQKEFTIKAGAHIMQVLSGLYRDPIDAMVREYLTNMHDAYVALRRNNPTAPVTNPVIHAPTVLSPYLEFRDYGIGMGMDTVWNVYSQYGNSTKNNSNDEVGGFGLGSKTAFCYNNGSTWNIESRFNNEMHVFAAFVGEDGIPQLTHVLSTPTDEHSGVTIRVPIRREDIPNVHKAIKKYVPYFSMDVTITGEPLDIPRKDIVIDGGTWQIVRSNGEYYESVVIVMGNVPYIVDRKYVYLQTEHSNFISGNTFILKVPVGSVDIVPSRDDLKYTDKTRAYIKAQIQKIVSEFPIHINAAIKNSTTEWEALENFMKYNDVRYANNLVQKITWNNIELTKTTGITRKVEDLQKLDKDATVEQYSITSTDRATLEKSIPIEINVSPFQTVHVFVNDEKRGGIGYVRGFMNKYVHKSYNGRTARYGHKVSKAIVLSTKLSADKLSAFLGGYPSKEIIFTSSLKSQNLPTVKAAKQEALYKWNGSSWASRATIPSDTTTKYYLPLVKNYNGRYVYPHGQDGVNALGDLYRDVLKNSVVYGIRVDDVSKFDATIWLNLETLVINKVTKYINDNKTLAENYKANLNKGVDKNLSALIENFNLHKVNALCKQYLTEAANTPDNNSILDCLKNNLHYLPDAIKGAWNLVKMPNATVNTIKDKIFQQYPVIELLHGYYGRMYYNWNWHDVKRKYEKLVLDNVK